MCKTVICLVILCISLFISGEKIPSNLLGYRLPTEVTPTHYSIRLHPHIDESTFDGEVSIYVQTKTTVDKITLHSSGLNITEVYINEIKANVTYHNHEQISLRFEDENEDIQPGEHRMFMKYSGVLDTSFGLTKATYSYGEHVGYLVANEFQPVSARKAFPCFDEPSYKAKFNIRLVAPNSTYTALSNMPEIVHFATPNGVVYDFATTVEMSTYLLSFAITDYPYYEEIYEENGRQIPIRVYTHKANKDKNQGAVKRVIQAIKYYSEYTNISYPLPKLDLIEYNKGISLASEMWGLIHFRQGVLSADSGSFDEFQTALIIFHELSHFWFGNLVTNNWWNELWLQEGFASYMSYKALSHETIWIEETKRSTLHELFNLERQNKTRAIVDYIRIAEDIETRFDTVIYDKGESIFVMLKNLIGEKSFQKVVQQYLSKFAYKTATTNDLIMTVENIEPNVNLRPFLESYIFQNRYPVINVDKQNGEYILTQTSCVRDKMTTTSFQQKWTIPIHYISDVEKEPKLQWFDREMDYVRISVPNVKWLLFNSIRSPGFYKVVYSDNTMRDFIENSKDLDQEEFENLLENAGFLFLEDMASCETVFRLFNNIKRKSSLRSFFLFYRHLSKKLSCSYPKDLEIVQEYLTYKFTEIGGKVPLKSLFKCKTDEKGEIKRTDIEFSEEVETVNTLDVNTESCVKWIRAELMKLIKNK